MPTIALLTLVFLSAKITFKLIVAHVSRSPLQQLDMIFAPSVLLYVLPLFGVQFDGPFFMNAYMLFSFANLALYWYSVMHEMLEIMVHGLSPAVARRDAGALG